MIKQFSVKNYKVLESVSIPLTPIHVVIGQNDSGKTSLLEAIHAFCSSTQGPLVDAFPGMWTGRELVHFGADSWRWNCWGVWSVTARFFSSMSLAWSSPHERPLLQSSP